MTRTAFRVLGGALTLAAVACGEATSPNAATDDLLANALTTLSPGVDQLTTSFSSSATTADRSRSPPTESR